MRSNYSNNLFKDYEKLISENDILEQENKYLKLRVIIAEDEQRRLQNKVDKKELEEQELKNQIKNQEETIQCLRKELERLRAIQNNDGTNSGIPTSQTPINKKKVIPNFAKNTGEKKGRKDGHPGRYPAH